MKQIYRDNYSRANIYLITRVIYFREPLATNGSPPRDVAEKRTEISPLR